MAHLICPRCHRCNPAEAVFCHYEGAELRPVGPGHQSHTQLPHEFVFKSGRRCKSYDELVQGCQYEWEDARDLLHKGAFRQYFASIGRMDLARAAEEAQTQASDPDIALHNFVERLPASQSKGPRLDLNPRRLMLGSMKAGESREVQLTITNQGQGLLHGTLKVGEGASWLRVGDGAGNGQCSLKAARDQRITLRIETRGLAAPQTYSARLTVITNGGIVEVPVRLDLASHPFPKAPFQGVSTPREMAEKMRATPKPAVPLLESGEVARWFEINSWTFPIYGRIAKGVAAVQQFFEGMGLSKPPTLQLSETEARFVCLYPDVAHGQVTVRTAAKKWVYAEADSDAPWLRVTTPQVSGPQQAAIAFEVDSTLMDDNRLYEGTIQVVANAGQKLSLRVRAEVRRPQEPFTRRLLRPFFAGALLGLIYRLFLAVTADVYARVLAVTSNPIESGPQHLGRFVFGFRSIFLRPHLPGTPVPGSMESWLQSPLDDPGFMKHFVLITFWLGALLGAVLLVRQGSRWTDVLCGTIAGAVAGVAGSATLACLMPILDWVPRRIMWRTLAALVKDMDARTLASPGLWTALWIVVAVGWWAMVGGAAGWLVQLAGRLGTRLFAVLGLPLSAPLDAIGLQRAAAFFALR